VVLMCVCMVFLCVCVCVCVWFSCVCGFHVCVSVCMCMYVYNDTTATILRGEIFRIEHLKDLDTGNNYPTVAPVATEALLITTLGVALGDILDAEYGFMQVEGDCPAILAEGTITAEDTLEVITTDKRATKAGTTKLAETFGVAKGATTVGLTFRGTLYGTNVVIKAT